MVKVVTISLLTFLSVDLLILVEDFGDDDRVVVVVDDRFSKHRTDKARHCQHATNIVPNNRTVFVFSQIKTNIVTTAKLDGNINAT